ncbi:MAG: LptF/LptG family permease [Planctomycetota bacterium]|nr:LptF/LptG family permease [Planctomycetota bacterium]MDA1105770.1 LptF/LptG family permease [Planctomycetota bacterium]
MPGILFRHTALDLLRVFVVTALVLAVVVAFGSLIKPLAANLLGPLSALRYAGMAMVPVLEYAVPFATAFACTLTTHRMAVDHEVTAMGAAGIPMSRILLPQVAVGSVCGLLLFAMVNTAVPEVENRMREMLAREAGRVVLSQLRDGKSVSAGNVVIHADAAQPLAVPEAPVTAGQPVPRDRLLLMGVTAFESAPDGTPLTEFVAKRAVVDLYELPSSGTLPASTALKMRLEDAVLFRPAEGSVASVPVVEPGAFVIGALGARPTKFLAGPELLGAIDEPGQTAQALEARRQLELELGDAIALLTAKQTLEEGGTLELVDPATARQYSIGGARLVGRVLTPEPGRDRFTVTERSGDSILRTATMRRATVERARGEWIDLAGGRWVSTDLVGDEAVATSAGNGAPLRWPRRLEGLRLPATPVQGNDDDELRRVTAQVSSQEGPWQAAILRANANWDRASRSVQVSAVAYLQLRLHAAALVPIAALLGAVAAVLLRGSSPLAVYAVAFLPTLCAVIIGAQGKEMIRDGESTVGLAVMWSGPAVMLLVGLLGLRKAGHP